MKYLKNIFQVTKNLLKILKNYFIIILKVIRRKQAGKINQSFICKHKINESNAEVATHYSFVCLYSEYVCFDVFMSNKSFNFFRNMLYTKTIKVNNFIIFCIQINPMCAYICIFIKVYYICSIFYCFRQIMSRINTIKSGLIFVILFYFKIC